ncbi:MAG: hypothetical protein REJ50_11660 [Bordetella sp.]|nr:hypothetical protein [Bordetella sp.]
MTFTHFEYHDLSQFPLVLVRHGHAPQGYAERWIGEMERLLAQPDAFVLIVLDLDTEIAHEDRKAMVQWQTANMARLRERCRGFIAIKQDPSALARTRAQAEKMTRAFGVAFVAAPDLGAARATALALLEQAREAGAALAAGTS